MTTGARAGVVLALSALATACAFVERHQSAMCPQIARFARSVEPGGTHVVTLRGGWGGDVKGTLMTHDCTHGGYAPGAALCEFLMPNTSWEFGERNAMAALACVDAPERRALRKRLETSDAGFELGSTLAGVADKEVRVVLGFRNQPNGLSVLDITATRSAVVPKP